MRTRHTSDTATSRPRRQVANPSPVVITRLSAPPTPSRLPRQGGQQEQQQQQAQQHPKRESIERSLYLDSTAAIPHDEGGAASAAAQGVSLPTAELWRDLLLQTGQQFAEAVDMAREARASGAAHAVPPPPPPSPSSASRVAQAAYVQRMGKAFRSLEALVEQMEETILSVKRIPDCGQGDDGWWSSGSLDGVDDPARAAALLKRLLLRERAEYATSRAALMGRLRAADETEAKLREEVASDFSIIEELTQLSHSRRQSQLQQQSQEVHTEQDDGENNQRHEAALQAQKAECKAAVATLQERLVHTTADHVQEQRALLTDACVRERVLMMEAEAEARALLWHCHRHVESLQLREGKRTEEGVAVAHPHREEAPAAAAAAAEVGAVEHATAATNPTSRHEGKGGPSTPPRQRMGQSSVPKQDTEAAIPDEEKDGKGKDSQGTPWPWTDYDGANADTIVAPISPLVLYDEDVAKDVHGLLLTARRHLQTLHEKQMMQLMERQEAERLLWRRRLDESEKEKMLLALHAEKLSGKLRELNTIEVTVGENGWESAIPGQHTFHHQTTTTKKEGNEPHNASGHDGGAAPATMTGSSRMGEENSGNLVWGGAIDLDASEAERAVVSAMDQSLPCDNGYAETSFGDTSPYADVVRSRDETSEEREEAYRHAMRAARAAIRELQLRNDQLTTKNRVLARELEEVSAPTPHSLVHTPFGKSGSASPPRALAYQSTPLRANGSNTDTAVDAFVFDRLFSPEHLPPYPCPARGGDAEGEEDSALTNKSKVNPTIWVASGCGESAYGGGSGHGYPASAQDGSSFLLPTIPLGGDDGSDASSGSRSSDASSHSTQCGGGGGCGERRGVRDTHLSPPKAPTRTPSET